MTQYDYTVITDIGSTTTKAIVIDCSQRKLLALEHADTTVEAPYNDVKIGIINAIKSIERQSGISLITDIKPNNSFSPAPRVRYLSTSSAGGGLQDSPSLTVQAVPKEPLTEPVASFWMCLPSTTIAVLSSKCWPCAIYVRI